MRVEWFLLALLLAAALWLGVGACQESKRLHARLSRLEIGRSGFHLRESPPDRYYGVRPPAAGRPVVGRAPSAADPGVVADFG
ncbi:MAG: hypothetical protein JO100_02430 [Pseudonocardia sp.]|nr:hypothetical protein [Pseudonocardia sp.]